MRGYILSYHFQETPDAQTTVGAYTSLRKAEAAADAILRALGPTCVPRIEYPAEDTPRIPGIPIA